MGQLRKSSRRVLLESSDTDHSPEKPPKTATRRETRNTGPTSITKQRTTSHSSPFESILPPEGRKEDRNGTKSIYSFFSTESTGSKGSSGNGPVARAELSRASTEELEITIDDDDGHDQSSGKLALTNGSSTALAVRKRGFAQAQALGASNDARSTSVSTSVKFIKTNSGDRKSSFSVRNGDKRPWIEQFAPSTSDDLAVHKRKVADVRTWLESAMTSRRPKILILKGPAGSGKTATIRAVAQDLSIAIQEWRAPNGDELAVEGHLSASGQFEEFIARSSRIGELALSSKLDVSGTLIGDGPSQSSRQGQRLVLIEEFPSTHSIDSIALQAFRLSLLRYLSAPPIFSGSIIPVVLVISETLLSTSTSLNDSFTTHRLLGADLSSHANLDMIEFNPIAPSILLRALELLVITEARISGRRRAPGLPIMKHLADSGDIRSAISSLEFLCLRDESEDVWSHKISFSKSKKAAAEIPLTSTEEDLLRVLSNRGSTLSIFHAVGRVVYNNRRNADPGEDVAHPPVWMSQNRRSKVPEKSADDLMTQVGTDVTTFILALQENYVPSCSSNSREEALESLENCITDLSDADLLSPDRFSSASRVHSGAASDRLRQEELSFHLAVNGLLFHLPSPVNRSMTQTKRKGDVHRMYFPTSIKSWKLMDGNENNLRVLTRRARQGALSSNSLPGTSTDGGVESWRTKIVSTRDSFRQDFSPEQTSEISYPATSRDEMLLERLPYLARIQAMSRSSWQETRDREMIRDLTRVGSYSSDNLDGIADDDALDEYTNGVGNGPLLNRLNSTDGTHHTPAEARTHDDLMARQMEDLREQLSSESIGNSLILLDDDIVD